MFHGAASEWRTWKAAQTELGLRDPSFVWPAGHAWCLANDVDPHWAGIGAGVPAVDELLADPFLDVVAANPRETQAGYE